MRTSYSKLKNICNGLLLSLVSYLLYLIMWAGLDRNFFMQIKVMPVGEYVFDFAMCMAFTYISLGLCRILFSVIPFKPSYVRAVVYAMLLLIVINAVAFSMACLLDYVWTEYYKESAGELINIQGTYTFAMIACFISLVYANVFYLQNYISTNEQRKKLELALAREKETALQSQLNALKLQINPHFMFNNFNTLLDMIEDDSANAAKFLTNLSKTYRHIIANLDRDVVPIEDEIKFLDSYIYLMRERLGDTIVINVAPELRQCSGYLPPAVLQLLVENAIKHNGHSFENPLIITIAMDASADYITVCNLRVPLESPKQSTGIGLKNIIERYALLCNRKVHIDCNDSFFSIQLPIISKLSDHENTDS